MQSTATWIDEIVIPRWRDRHLHVRKGRMLKTVLPCTLEQLATGAVIMGNLEEPITTIQRARDYRKQIMEVVEIVTRKKDFDPRVTLYLTDEISPEEVVRGFKEGAWCAVKLYMASQSGQGGTTGSQHGVRNLLGRYPVFEAMADHQIPLLGHFEAVEPGVDEFDREFESLQRDLKPLLEKFPRLPVVVEHVTDSRMAEFVANAANFNIQATVTAHHLMINRNAMFINKDGKRGMCPAHYCLPVPKREEHRLAIRKLVTSGHHRFGAGTDSAPHDWSKKAVCCGCAAGIFTAKTAVELYTTVFDEDGATEHLGAFMSKNFVQLYGMKESKEMMTIKRTPLKIPKTIGQGTETVPVFMGGETLPWTLVTKPNQINS